MLPDPATMHVFYGTVSMLIAAIVGVWNNNPRLKDFGKRIDDLNKRMDDLRISAHEEFTRVENRVRKVEDQIGDLEKGVRMVKI